MKKCPYCAEEIQDEAIVCKHCGRDLRPRVIQPSIAAEKPKKKGLVFVIGCLVIIFLAVVVFACGIVLIGGDTSTSHKVTYNVTGTARGASVTYENAQGGTEQGSYSIPWTISFTMKYGDYAYISAQNNRTSGSVTCTILVDGKAWKTSTSEGAYVIADCSGLIGHE